MNKKKEYQEPTYHIIKVRTKLSLLAGSVPATDPYPSDARHNDMDDMDDY